MLSRKAEVFTNEPENHVHISIDHPELIFFTLCSIIRSKYIPNHKAELFMFQWMLCVCSRIQEADNGSYSIDGHL